MTDATLMTDTTRLPYPGLRAYLRSETDLFFGRESCTDEMVDKLAATRFLAVLGSSGSGKSSLVRTGLLDAFDLGLHPGGWDWRIAEMAPGEQPIRNLARALLDSTGAASDPVALDALHGELEHSPLAVARWALANLAEGQNLLILVDQFEELFRYGDYAGREEAESFVALLLESTASGAPISVVITMRSEFLGACALIPGLVERINAGLYLTRRMTREECRAAIEGPAGVLGFEIEPALVTRLLNDMAEFAPWDGDAEVTHLERLSRRADQLPLMQHVLNRLWTRSTLGPEGQTRLMLADYLTIGELSGALDQHGADVLASLGPLSPAAEPVFRGLVSGTSLASAVRRPARLGDLVALTALPEADVRRVIEAFRAPGCNFLRPAPPAPLDTGTVIDISHESLIRQWETLAGWLRQETEDGARWRQLAVEAAANARGEADLLSDTNLGMAETWLSVVRPTLAWAARHGGGHQMVTAFVAASRAAVDDRRAEELRRRRGVAWLRGGVVALLVLLAVGAGLGWQYQRELNEELASREKELLAANDELTQRTADANEARLKAETAELEQTRLNAELEAKNSALEIQRRAAETQARNLADLNRSLQDFKQRSVDVVSQFGKAMDDIQEAAVLGFTEHERTLSEIIRPFQAYTLANAGELLDPENVILVKFTYASTLDRLGDSGAGIREMEEAYTLAKAKIDRAVRPMDLGVPFIATFFDIVTYHSWNLMNAGDFDSTAGILKHVAMVEADLPPDPSDARLLDGLASVFNVRGRWYDEQNREEEAHEHYVRAKEYLARAIAVDPDNSYYARKYGTYLGNSALQSRKLAGAIENDAPDRAESLRTEATAMENERCEVFAGIYARSRLTVTNNVLTWSECVETWTQLQRTEGDFNTARQTTDDALDLVDMLIAFDPDRQQLKLAKLRMLDAAYDVESFRANGLHKGKIETGEALLAYWLQVVSRNAQLPADVWVLDNTFSTISYYLEQDGIDLDRRIASYTTARDAIAASLEAFPNARRYRQLDAKAAFKLIETIRKTDQADPRLLPLLQTLAAHHEALGSFDTYAVPDEIFAEACDGYSGQVRVYKELKRADEMLAVLKTLMDRCAPIVNAHPWDFYLWQKPSGANFHAGTMLFELGRYDEAKGPLEYADYWYLGDASALLARMYRLGLGVEPDPDKVAHYLARVKKGGMKRFTIPTQFGPTKHPFDVYLKNWPEDFAYQAIDGQVKWLEEYRGGLVPADVVEAFHKLLKLANENNVSFLDLAVYALGTAAEENVEKYRAEIEDAKGADFQRNPRISTDSAGIAIGGYDPVAYETSRAVLGSTEFHAVHDGAVWLFESAANRDLFAGDPDAHMPAFGGYCVTCMAGEQKRHSDPTAFRRREGRTYLFWSPTAIEEFEGRESAHIHLAERRWRDLADQEMEPADPSHATKDRDARASERAADENLKRRIAEVLTTIRDGHYRDAFLQLQTIASEESKDAAVKQSLSEMLGELSYYAVMAGEAEVSVQAAELGLEVAEDLTWLETNRAHGLMFLGRVDEARSLYMSHRASLIHEDRLWDDEILKDFAALRERGRTHPLMDEIEALFRPKVDVWLAAEAARKASEGGAGDP